MSRFDRLVLSTLFVLALLIGALAWRGDHVGATVVSVSPAQGATGRLHAGGGTHQLWSGDVSRHIGDTHFVQSTCEWNGALGRQDVGVCPFGSAGPADDLFGDTGCWTQEPAGATRSGSAHLAFSHGPDTHPLRSPVANKTATNSWSCRWKAASPSRSRKSLSASGIMRFRTMARPSFMPRCIRTAAAI